MSAERKKPIRSGRPVLSDSMRRAVGRPRKRTPTSMVGISSPVELPACPKELGYEGAIEWERAGKYLLATGRVAQVDLQALFAYCSSWQLWLRAAGSLLAPEANLWGLVGEIQMPKPVKMEEIARRHGMAIIAIARRFGMTARTRHLDHADTGRPALPDELHELRGNPSKKRLKGKITDALDRWDPADVAAPSAIEDNPIAIAEWHRLAKALSACDLFTPLDRATLAVGCTAYAIACRSANLLQDQPLDLEVEATGLAVEHPLSQIYRRQWQICEQVWKDFGMSPLDRRRFKHAAGPKEEKKRLKIFVGR